jgi:cell division protein FtsB
MAFKFRNVFKPITIIKDLLEENKHLKREIRALRAEIADLKSEKLVNSKAFCSRLFKDN